jgi:hypothetical protein
MVWQAAECDNMEMGASKYTLAGVPLGTAYCSTSTPIAPTRWYALFGLHYQSGRSMDRGGRAVERLRAAVERAPRAGYQI